jgi:murein hydrolase activator
MMSALFATHAPSQTEAGAPNAADLQAVERDIERARASQEEAAQRAARTAENEVAVRNKMIAAAQRIQERERVLIELEDQLTSLESRRSVLADTLEDKDAQMRDVLMALQRLAVRPTDALLLQPLRPSDAIRSGLVLSAAIPALTDNANRLRVGLESLYRTRTEIIERRSEVAANAAALITDQSNLERLYAEKAELRAGFEQRAAEATTRMDALSKEADDLRDLLDKVVADRKRQIKEEAAEKAAKKMKQAARRPTTLPPPDGTAPTPGIVVARRPAPPQETRSFAQARGTLPFPVIGQLTQRYGGKTEGDVRSKGIVIKTRTDAQVVTPFDAVVAFSGPFRGYGQLLILEHSEGYHTLLAGMSHLDGAVGQTVLAGEPVGVMAPEGVPSLYVEMRRGGQPINPLPWLATQTNENHG